MQQMSKCAAVHSKCKLHTLLQTQTDFSDFSAPDRSQRSFLCERPDPKEERRVSFIEPNATNESLTVLNIVRSVTDDFAYELMQSHQT